VAEKRFKRIEHHKGQLAYSILGASQRLWYFIATLKKIVGAFVHLFVLHFQKLH
jgi:hypothetical protein